MLIRTSPRYVDRVTENLQSLLHDADKMTSLSRLMVTRQHEARQEEELIIPRLELIRKKTKELKTQV